MAWSLINNFQLAAASTSPITFSTLSGIAIGDLLVVMPFGASGDITATVAITDNASSPNTYTKEKAQYLGADGVFASKFSAPILNVTSLTSVMMSWSGGGSLSIDCLVEQWRNNQGSINSSPISGTPAGNTQQSVNGTDAVFSGNTTPAVNGCLIHGFGVASNTLNTGTGYTTGVQWTVPNMYTEYKTQAVAAAVQATFTTVGTLDAFSFVTAYAPPSVGPGGPGVIISISGADNQNLLSLWNPNNDGIAVISKISHT